MWHCWDTCKIFITFPIHCLKQAHTLALFSHWHSKLVLKDWVKTHCLKVKVSLSPVDWFIQNTLYTQALLLHTENVASTPSNMNRAERCFRKRWAAKSVWVTDNKHRGEAAWAVSFKSISFLIKSLLKQFPDNVVSNHMPCTLAASKSLRVLFVFLAFSKECSLSLTNARKHTAST